MDAPNKTMEYNKEPFDRFLQNRNMLEKESIPLKLNNAQKRNNLNEAPIFQPPGVRELHKKFYRIVVGVFAVIGLILLITLIAVFSPILRDKHEINAQLATMSKLVQDTHSESETLRKESSKLLHDLHLCQNNSHETRMLLLKKGASIAAFTAEKDQFQRSMESLESQIAAKESEMKALQKTYLEKDTEMKLTQKNSEMLMSERDSQLQLLKRERSRLQHDFQSCQSNQHETSLLLQNKSAKLVSLTLEKMALAAKVDDMEHQLTQNLEKKLELASKDVEVESLKQQLGNKKLASTKLETCLEELHHEKKNNSMNLLTCKNVEETEKMLQEQAKQNDVLNLKVQSLLQQLNDLKALIMKNTEATTKTVVDVIKSTKPTPIQEQSTVSIVEEVANVLNSTEAVPIQQDNSPIVQISKAMKYIGSLFSAGSSVLPSLYTLSLNVALIMAMKFFL